MCSSCEGQDYIEDFAYEASDAMGVGVELIDFEPLVEEGFRARFSVGKGGSPRAQA
jgi:hypothetical protein